MRRKIIFYLLLLACVPLQAQQLPQLSESAVETQEEMLAASGQEEMPDPEEDIRLDLNSRDISELLSSSLITPVQAQALVTHREHFGLFLVPEELQVIDAFDTAFIRRIRPYLVCGKPLVEEHFRIQALLSASRHEVLLRSRRILQDKSGFGDDGRYPFYTGDPWQHLLRYRMRAGNYFSAGLVMEKDAGERLYAPSGGGRMDFFSWHVYLRPNRFLKNLLIGDYQFQFGQGLVAWNGLSLGKSAEVSQAYRRGQGFRPYASAAEDGFNRGLAASLQWKTWNLDAWFSYRRRDASLFRPDTTSDAVLVSSILTSGLHRSYGEIEDKALLGHQSSGLHLQWESERWRNEGTLQQQHFDHALWPGDDPYERFDPSGKNFLNYGWASRYLLNNATLYMEAALDGQGQTALVLGALFMPDRRWTISLHLRRYDRDYQCISCDGLREGSKTQNEQGFYSGIQWQLHQQLRMQAYLDRFQFPWLRYTSSAPSGGSEYLLQLSYLPSRSTEAYLRYRQEEKPGDAGSERFSMPLMTVKRNLRFNLQWMQGKNWEFQSRCEWVGSSTEGQLLEGILFFQEARYKPLGKPYSISLRWAVFHTEDYEARIYTYEQDMAGSFSLPAYSGKGIRYYLLCRHRLGKGLDIWFRFSTSIIRSVEGADESQKKEELKAQIRWQF
ncbi:MAG: hypothetical protein JNL88_09540 [Bacteroidia bacterium]|nr:hypothetical protein [Bacteroidia bacterium]